VRGNCHEDGDLSEYRCAGSVQHESRIIRDGRHRS
jgi:hypothetical protein